jgi:sugar phosphate permease
MPVPLPAVHRLFPGVFYGWVVVVGTSVLSFVTVGVGFYGLPVLLDGLVALRGWAPAAVSGATSLYFVVAAVTGSLVGRGVDHFGARGFIAAGAVLMACALVGIGRVERVGELYLLYPLMAAGFAMSAGVPTSAIVTRWFVARRALAMSISQTGVSIGGIVLVPLATGILLRDGLAATTGTLAVLVVAVALPVVVLVLRSDPAPHGLQPDAGRRPPPENPFLRAEVQQRPWRTREALRTAPFWTLAGAFSMVLFAQQGMSVHLIAFLREPLGASSAAFAISAMAAGSVVGRLIVGSFADRVEKRLVAIGLVLLQAAAYLILSAADGPFGLFAASMTLGLTIGNLFMFQSLLVGEIFGAASFGTVLGMLTLVSQVVGGLGPFALGLLSQHFGAYQPAIRMLVVLTLVAALLLTRLRPARRV